MKALKKSQTNNIYLWKILFTYMIVVFHYPYVLSFLYERGYTWGWYIAVEFFFVVSGYLIYRNIDKNKSRFSGAWQFTLHRYKNIWPKYLMAFVAVFVAICITQQLSFRAMLSKLIDSVLEILMLQGIGLDRGWNYINPTLWYISILIIAGYVIYWFLANHRDVFVKIIMPICIVIGYSYLYRHVGNIDAAIKTEGIFQNQALIRGFCDMGLGIYAAMLTEFFGKKFKHTWGLRVIEVALVLLVMYISLAAGHSTNDFVLLLMIVLIVAIGFIPRRFTWIDIAIEKWASITLNIYLVHELIRTYIMNVIYPDIVFGSYNIQESIVYIVLVTVAGILLECLWLVLRKICSIVIKREDVSE